MTTTALDICRRAHLRLQLIGAAEELTAEDASDTLAALNDMMFALEADGADVWHTRLELTDNFALDDQYVRGVAAMLAVYIAPDYGREPSPLVVTDAENGKRQLMRDFETPDNLKVDRGLPRPRRLGWRL